MRIVQWELFGFHWPAGVMTSISAVLYTCVWYIYLFPHSDVIINIINTKCAKALKPNFLSDSLQSEDLIEHKLVCFFSSQLFTAIKLENTLATATAEVPLKFTLQAQAAEVYAEFM